MVRAEAIAAEFFGQAATSVEALLGLGSVNEIFVAQFPNKRVVIRLPKPEDRHRAAAFYEKEAWCLAQATALDPNGSEAHHNLGDTLTRLGRIDDAIAALRRAIALRPDQWESHQALGNALKEAGELDQAIDQFRQVLALAPGSRAVHEQADSEMGARPMPVARRLMHVIAALVHLDTGAEVVAEAL